LTVVALPAASTARILMVNLRGARFVRRSLSTVRSPGTSCALRVLNRFAVIFTRHGSSVRSATLR
jgi:hypothetical protein